MSAPPPDEPLFVDVALPLPLPEPLTYTLPPGLFPGAVPGVRVQVRMGRRRLSGMVVAIHSQRPARLPPEVEVRPIEALLDREPLVPPDLLELARFLASYYFAPLGEVLRAVLPGDLPSWGTRRYRLTNAGALALPHDAEEEKVVEALRGGEWVSASALQEQLGIEDLDRVLARLGERGRIAGDDRDSRKARYVAGFDLVPGDPEALRQAVGRSAQGRAVVDYLQAVGRPATQAGFASLVQASPAVLRRLVKLGVLRAFTQVERLDLDRHRMQGGEESRGLTLRPDQQEAFDALSRAIVERRFAPILLVGMTGSGKTEVYLRAAEEALALGRSAIFLVPEIALVPALARTAEQRFGDRLAILHSGLSAGERLQEWERIRRGEARVVLGPRSALFAPVTDLGLLVVDEEHDPAYKQETTPRYHARDLALVRGRSAHAATLLVSATPSLESRLNAERGKLLRLALTVRAGGSSLPEGILVDLRQEEKPPRPGEVAFSERLRQEITSTLAAGDQVILLRNRRGYSPMLLCRACGEDIRCDACGLPRTYHRRLRRLVCHYCGSTLSAPDLCPACGQEALEPIGAGTERVEEQFQENLFPGVSVDVLDRDTARRAGGPAALLERFGRGDVQVLIGTQMVSKGHHFPNVALAAVLTADAYLAFPDFRAVERTYSLLTQLAGRAGRGERPGKVVIQTYHPNHYAIRAALTGDDEGFAREEMRFRRTFHYPPYTRMVQLLVKDRNRERAERTLRELANRIARHPASREVRQTGPAPAPFERLRGEWRFQLLLRATDREVLARILRDTLPEKPGFDLTVDVDPQQLL